MCSIGTFSKKIHPKRQGHSKYCTSQNCGKGNSLVPELQIPKFCGYVIATWWWHTINVYNLICYKVIHFQCCNHVFWQATNQMGICSPGSLGVIIATVWEVQFFLVSFPIWMNLLRKGAYKDISHIILKYTQKVTSWYQKYLNRRKERGGGGGGEVMTATNMLNFGGFRCIVYKQICCNLYLEKILLQHKY